MIYRERIRQGLEGAHLVYLGLLPALATFVTLMTYGTPVPFLVFLGGIVAVSVYLAVVVSYTASPKSLGVAVLTLVDGPAWAFLASARGTQPFAFAIDSFLIDGVAIWVAIVWLAITTSRPTKEQRIATLFFALVAVVTVLSLFWPYVRDHVWGKWTKVFWLGVGMVEAVMAHHYLLKIDKVERDEGLSAPYIAILIFVWVAAMIAGNVVHELQ